MKYEKVLQSFWIVVWAVVLGLTIAGLFWRPALYIEIGFAAMMLLAYIRGYIRIKRMF